MSPMGLIKHRTSATNPGTSNNQAGSGRHGGIGDSKKRGEFGTIQTYDSDTLTATVLTERGRELKGVPRLRSTPGEVIPLPAGTEVLISHDYGRPIIMGVLTLPAVSNSGTSSFSVSDVAGFGGEGLNRSTLPNGNFRNAAEPRDLIPGDWAQVGQDGNSLAILGGGTNVMKSSTLAQVRTHLVNDLVEIISRNFRHVTDMGEFRVTNDDGRVNMSFRGATDQRSEAGPDEENWTIRMDLGSEGDMFNLEFSTPQGQTLFKFHVDAEGHCEIFGMNGVNLASGSRSGGAHEEEHNGDSSKFVGGEQTETTRGAKASEVGANESKDIGGDKTTAIGNDWRTQAFRDVAVGAGRNMAVNVQGPQIPLPGSPAIPFAPQILNPAGTAVNFDIENGDMFIEIGSPLVPPKVGNFVVKTFQGDIVHECIAPGATISTEALLGTIENRALAFKASTNLLPNSVILGGEFIASHLVKWEELFAYLSALHFALDLHVHPITATAFAGPLAVNGATLPPLIPIGAPLSGMLPTFMSLVAGVAL